MSQDMFLTRQAHSVRRHLADALVYPTGDLSQPHRANYERHIRAQLPAMLAQLDRPDLAAVYRVVECMLAAKRSEGLFAYIASTDVPSLVN